VSTFAPRAAPSRAIGVVAHPEAVDHARREGDHVLGRPGGFHADHIIVPVDPQPRHGEQRLDAAGDALVGAGRHHGRGLLPGKLGGDGRADQHAHRPVRLRGIITGGVGDDLGRPQQRRILDALGDADDGRRPGGVRSQALPHGADELRGDRVDDQGRRLEERPIVGRHLDLVGQDEPRQPPGRASRAGQLIDVLGEVPPETGGNSLPGQHLRQHQAHLTVADDGDLLTHFGSSFGGTGPGPWGIEPQRPGGRNRLLPEPGAPPERTTPEAAPGAGGRAAPIRPILFGPPSPRRRHRCPS